MKKILLFATAFAFALISFSQTETMELQDSTNLKKCKLDQQYDYENHLNAFPPKKKNNWVVGVGIGSPMIQGDVNPVLGQSIGGDIEVRKAFSHVFSLRYQGVMALMKGVNYKLHPTALGLAPLNHRTVMTDNSLQAMFTLNNINFHKKQAKVAFNIFAGVGVSTSFTKFNLYDENGNAYDYSNLSNIETFGDKRFVRNEVRNLLDEGFETIDKIDGKELNYHDNRILPSLLVGAGLDFRLSRRVDLSLESRISKHFTDELDGHRVGNGNDWFLYSSVGLNFKIGKGEETATWQNPLAQSYTDVMELKKGATQEELFQDLDKDGVLDIFDLDLNTPNGVEVNSKGQALDYDKDGIPNYKDKELHSPDGAKVDAYGRAIDSDGDGVPDVLDLEANTPNDVAVDNNGRSINTAGNSKGGKIMYLKGVDVWSIFFDTDQANVKKDYHPIVLNLASYMIADPSVVIILTGYTDIRATEEYNLQLSKKRANNVLKLFTDLGIDASRFEVNFKGEADPTKSDSNLGLQLNRRVTLQIK